MGNIKKTETLTDHFLLSFTVRTDKCNKRGESDKKFGCNNLTVI